MMNIGTLSKTITFCIVSGLIRLALAPDVYSQAIPDTSRVEVEEEGVLESIDEESGDATQLIELLQSLRDNPLDINTATVESLSDIPALGVTLATQLVTYREASGAFTSIPELQLVPGITEDVFLRMRPYVTIGDRLESKVDRPSRFPETTGFGEMIGGMRYDLIQRVTRRLTLGNGYDDDTTRTTYLGSPERIYTRFKGNYSRRFGFNMTLEKDPGEVFEWNPDVGTYAYDHVTGHVFLKDYGRIKSLVVGDYVVNFGQGLGLWQSIAIGKSRESTSAVLRSGRGVSPYGSTDENNFFRGAAATILITPEVGLTTFLSRRSLDATAVAVDTSDGFVDETAISSINSTGLHRTPNEILRKDVLQEDVIGGALQYSSTRMTLGATAYRSQFDQPLLPGDRIDERFDFSGSDFTMASLFGRLFLNDYSLFGEIARDDAGTVAGLGGLTASAGRMARAVLLARHYPSDFTSLHGYGFGERNGTSSNESGVYMGVQVVPSRKLRINAYFDQYSFPWARFGVSRPSSGYEALLYVQHKPRRWLSHYIQAKTETKEAGFGLMTDNSIELDALIDETRQSVRWHLDYEFSKQLKTRSRLEGVRFERQDELTQYGFMLYQDVRWVATPRITFDTRIMFFDTDTFDARVFAYEYDLRYTFSVPAFSGQGQRAYLMTTFEPIEDLLIQAKYAATRFENEETIGSGLDEAEGNILRELRLQLFFKF